MQDFAAIWRAADKIVYSSSLAAVSTSRTRLERRLAPDSVRELKARAARGLTVRGPRLAGHALALAWWTSASCSLCIGMECSLKRRLGIDRSLAIQTDLGHEDALDEEFHTQRLPVV